MRMTYTIRDAKREDLNGKAYVHWQSWKETYAGLVDPSFLAARTREASLKYAEHAFDVGYPTLIAADERDRVIGFADYGPCRDADAADAGEVYAIYVLREYYGTGVGPALMNAALEQLKDRPKAVVWVLQGNERAIRFYQKMGFRFDGKQKTIRLGSDVTELRMILFRDTPVVFYFSPHQDDELLNLGTAMCKDIDAGREVFCVLCTDGGASGARRLIDNGGACRWHEGAHDHPLTVAEFSAARDREFTASCLAMGLSPAHIIIPADRAPDGQLTAERAADIMRSAIKDFPAEQVTLKTLAEVTWQRQNPDHTAVARAALRLREENVCAAAEEYLETILFPAPEGNGIPETLTPDAAQRERLLAAAANYCRWEPENGFYAVGCHSVWDEFDEFRREQFSRLMIRR